MTMQANTTTAKPVGLYDESYDAEACMIRVPFQSPGYHSRVANGTMVHPTNPSLLYALELVGRNDPSCDERAGLIIRKVIALQDQDPINKTYGIWPWLLEEPISAMAPPDWNWADFCGFRLASILVKAANRFDPDLVKAMRESLSHAAECIYRRNVGTHYTNICVMGGIVTTLAGEILNDPRMLAYGRRRLAEVVTDHERIGSFNEYNSPTYTKVVLWDCEEALGCLKDKAARESVEYIFRQTWKVIADHFHPATGQWAGPHSRDYTSFMTQEMSQYIAFKTGVRVKTHPLATATTKVSPLVGWITEPNNRDDQTKPAVRSSTMFAAEAAVCPPEFVERFRRLPAPEFEITEQYFAPRPPYPATRGTTWTHEEICLGSVNRDFFMDQRRAVLAFWNDAHDTPVVLRLRFMHDGREFSSACSVNAQRGGSVLSAVHLLLGQGDFHPSLDVPPNNTFEAEDFRLRYELCGKDIEALELDGGVFSLSAGNWSALISPARSTFAGHPVTWTLSRGDGWAAIDGVCYQGPRIAFPFHELPPVTLAAALTLQRRGRSSTAVPAVHMQPGETSNQFQFGDLKVSVPSRAVPMFG